MRKDTKVYPSASGDFERPSAAVGSSVVGSDRSWMSMLYLIGFRIDKDTPIDKEYTGIDKISMCICGDFAVFMSGLGASFATQSVRTIGCEELAVGVSSLSFVTQNRSSTGVIARASGWSASSRAGSVRNWRVPI